MYKFVISFLIIFVCVFLTNQININNSTKGTAHDKIFDRKPSYWTSFMKRISFSLKNGVKKINQVKQQIWKRLPSNKTHILYKVLDTTLIKKDDPFYVNDIAIPPSFDARKHWKNCTIIGEIIDQGRCGNCWATATIGVFSDRLCIATKGQVNKLLSIEYLTFCCVNCVNRGCLKGNRFVTVWQHLINYGVVTGGRYSTADGCQPYRIMPCYDNVGKFTCSERPFTDNECFKGCYGNSSIDFEKDHWKEIPITNGMRFVVYEVIPLPVQIGQNQMVFIKTKTSYIAVDRAQKNVISFEDCELGRCKVLEGSYVCPNEHLINLGKSVQSYDQTLFCSPPNIPSSCNKNILFSKSTMWHRLSGENAWLCDGMNETIVILCENEIQPIRVNLDNTAKDAYWLDYKNMQKEILLYGPIQTYFFGHQDFHDYENGIFQKSSITEFIGQHSVKVIGWGEEEGVKFWLCVNSWSKYWGENGLFRIIRGTDEYSFESWAYAGRPLVFEKEGIYYPFDPYKNKYLYR